MYILPETSRRHHKMQVGHTENSCPWGGVCEKYLLYQSIPVQWFIVENKPCSIPFVMVNTVVACIHTMLKTSVARRFPDGLRRQNGDIREME